MDKEIKTKKRFVFELSEQKHREIKIAAVTLGMPMKDFLEKAIALYVHVLKKRQPNIYGIMAINIDEFL